MNLYRISQDHNKETYDVYDSAIVCAGSEEEAKLIHPDGGINKLEEEPFSSWAPIQYVSVEFIGTAKEGLQSGVVCASFIAG